MSGLDLKRSTKIGSGNSCAGGAVVFSVESSLFSVRLRETVRITVRVRENERGVREALPDHERTLFFS